jgi:molybdopterin-synthase adenylyltransferase
MPHPSKAVVGVTPAIVGSVEASETIKWICNYGDILLGKLWVIDLKTLQTNIIEL